MFSGLCEDPECFAVQQHGSTSGPASTVLRAKMRLLLFQNGCEKFMRMPGSICAGSLAVRQMCSRP